MEIICRKGNYRIKHDGREFSEDEIYKHVSQNGHDLESAGFVMPFSHYFGAKEIADKIEEIFHEKSRINRR